MQKILFLDACPRSESRTRRLAEAVVSKSDGDVTTLHLEKLGLKTLDESALEHRYKMIKNGILSAPEFEAARQFASADEIVLAAPLWDLSFPALVKLYFEHICILGITFRYNEKGVPEGLCRASRLCYVSSSGGPFISDFGFDYIKALSQQFFGIPKVDCIYAENLDIVGNDPEKILNSRIAQL